MKDFMSEDDLKTFSGWLRYQGVDPSTTTAESLELWRLSFEDALQRCLAAPKVGLMKLQPVPGENRYGVAVREVGELWLTLWVRRSWKGEYFVMVPRIAREWDVHTSYHLDGTLHIKSYGHMVVTPIKRQPLTGQFRGTESLAVFSGHAPKSVGAICDPQAFSGVVEIAPGVLGPRDGAVAVDLVEPGCEPTVLPWTKVFRRDIFRENIPWVVLTVGNFGPPPGN